jgi:predicted acyl esterase
MDANLSTCFIINLNTGKTMIESSKAKTATQTIYHQQEFPSHILLPIIKS